MARGAGAVWRENVAQALDTVRTHKLRSSLVILGVAIGVTTLMAMVTMPISRWNQVLEVLGQQPWREINPAIIDIHRQLQDAVNAQTGQGNGMSTLRQMKETQS